MGGGIGGCGGRGGSAVGLWRRAVVVVLLLLLLMVDGLLLRVRKWTLRQGLGGA